MRTPCRYPVHGGAGARHGICIPEAHEPWPVAPGAAGAVSGGRAMEENLTAATWFWLLVPMLLVVVLTLVSLVSHKLRGERS